VDAQGVALTTLWPQTIPSHLFTITTWQVFEVPTHPGYVKADQIVKALTQYGTAERSTLEEAEELVAQLEADPNGLINYEEYIKMMMNEG
jgi:Ca2+-binding EF-hand superfamily protein